MFRRALACCLVLAPLAAAPVAANADDVKLAEPGKLTWAASTTFKPFEFMVDGKPNGFDVDIADALAKRIGLTSNLMAMDFKGVMPALLGDRVDIAVSGLYMTPARLEVADMIPYVLLGNQIVVQAGNPKHVPGTQPDLCGVKVAVPTGTAWEASLKKTSADCAAAGKPEVDVLSLPGSDTVALALRQGRVDAALNSTATIAAMISDNPGVYGVAGPPFDTNTRVGIALRKDEGPLKAQLEQALQAAVKDGTYAGLMKKWNLPPSLSAF